MIPNKDKPGGSMKSLALALAFISFSSIAATSASLNLKGKVASILAISLVPESVALTLPLDITQTDTLVGTVNERSNSGTGYKVTITSDNAGNLKRTNGVEVFAYSLKYNGTVLNLASPVVEVHPAVAVDVFKSVSISYTGIPASQMIAGTYTDKVTFTIAVN